jgi:hypothetical protein
MDNKRKQLLVIAAVACFGIFVADRVVARPLIKLWRARTAEIADLQLKLEKGEKLLSREDTVRRRWREMQKRSLPAEESLAENAVLQAVSRWSTDSRLNLGSLKPRWIEGDESQYKRVEFNASAQGTLESITQFLFELEHDPLAVKIEQVELTAQDDKGSQLTVDVRFSGLVLAEGSAK